MQIPPRYEVTPKMIGIIAKIDANREFIASINPPKIVIEKIHSASLLKSSLYSARIEGHTATFEELDEKKQEQLEIFNILKTIRYIKRQVKKNTKINKTFVSRLHSLAMQGISGEAGRFRTESTAIFNQAGVVIYLPPPPIKVSEHILALCTFINGKYEQFPLVNAFITHLIFEKIHPFLDGNGRVGRLLVYAIFQSKGYDFGMHIPFEEYIDNHKQDYYYALDIGLQDPNEYLVFMLEAYYAQTENIKKLLLSEQNSPAVLLPPRQEEIYRIIRDHKTISLDFISRRFMKVPKRTIRYDLKKLVDAGLVAKIGQTRGVIYTVVKK